MTTISGKTTHRHFVAAAALAVVTTLGLAGSASAVTQADAEAQLRAAGIGWTSSGGCTTRSNPTCTSFSGIRQATISRREDAEERQRLRPCTITGGTEVGHAGGTYSHYNGYKLDFSRTSCLTSWVHNTYSYIGLRGDGAPQYQSRLRQRVRRRGQPLGRHLLHLRLLTRRLSPGNGPGGAEEPAARRIRSGQGGVHHDLGRLLGGQRSLFPVDRRQVGLGEPRAHRDDIHPSAGEASSTARSSGCSTQPSRPGRQGPPCRSTATRGRSGPPAIP